MGKDCIVADTAVMKRLFTLGDHVAIDDFFYCTVKLFIGDYVHIAPHVSIIGGGTRKFVAKGFNNIMAGARIICASDRFNGDGIGGALISADFRGKVLQSDITMEPFSNIGTNAIVLPGTKLKMGVLIAAGSLIMGETEPWVIYKGNPAIPAGVVTPDKILANAKEMGYEY
jgi:acetyltransferase-like isoleucine patch superfamily enzyme